MTKGDDLSSGAGGGVGVIAAPDQRPASAKRRRFGWTVVRLFRIPMLLGVLLGTFIIIVDAYWIFGMPSLPWINESRPFYESYVVQAKPYQLARLRPKVVALGSSRAEVGLSPDHPGWADRHAFNFSIPAANSYEVMLAFLYAESLAAPLKQAVVGLDFLSFGIYRKVGPAFAGERFFYQDLKDFADFLDVTLAERRAAQATVATTAPPPPKERAWDERLYLALYPDVAAAIANGLFKSGRDHYERAGRAEGRHFGAPPADWDEAGYLQAHPDVAQAVANKVFVSGYHHYYVAGRVEKRLGGLALPNWDEAGYLVNNPDVRISIASGQYRTGYIHYAAGGRRYGRVGGLPPANFLERIELLWPPLHGWLYKAKEVGSMTISPVAIKHAAATPISQSTPPSFSDRGQRIWRGQDEVIRLRGGVGKLYRAWLGASPAWKIFWFDPPELMYCFTHPQTGMSGFDPFRFMVRRAYSAGTDLRLFVSPINVAVRKVIDGAGLGPRFDFWLREIVRINEEEAARAGREPFPLWDFSDTNTITAEPIPASGDLKPMRWFWEVSHYRSATGDMILDRIFGTRDPLRPLPDDFGVRVTSASIEGHLRRERAKRDQWVAANADLAGIIAKAASGPRTDRQAEATCW